MRTPPAIALSLALLAAAGTVWLSGRPLESRGASRSAPRAARAPSGPESVGAARLAAPSVGPVELAPSERRVVALEPAPAAVEAWPALSSAALDEPVRVHGRVRRSGRPAAGHVLSFRAQGGGRFEAEADWDFTDALGCYEVWLPPGRYAVLNDDDGPWTENVVVAGSEAAVRLDLDLPTGVLRGRVVAPESGGAAGLGGATVIALRATSEPVDALTQDLMARGGRATTRADGSFELTGLRPGTYEVTAERDGRIAAPVHVRLGDASARDLNLCIEPGCALAGIVRGPDGRTVPMDLWIAPGERLTALAQLFARPVLSSGYDGLFRFEDLPPGVYRIFGVGGVGASDLVLWAAVDVRPAGPRIELTARARGRLSVTVARPDGAPVAGARLELRSADGELLPASLTWLEEGLASGDDGRMELADVMPGEYRVRVSERGRLAAPARAEVHSGETTELRLVVGPDRRRPGRALASSSPKARH